MNIIKILSTTCWVVLWKKCKLRQSNLKWPVWRVGSSIRIIPFNFIRVYSSRWVVKTRIGPTDIFRFVTFSIFQIWAANDIKIFIRMMTQRNVELQLQALDLIEKNQLALFQQGESFDSPSESGRQSQK